MYRAGAYQPAGFSARRIPSGRNGSLTTTISVIVPFLNEERYIRRCVDSLLACDYLGGCAEFIFIDNGSTDHGPRIVSEYPEVTLLTETRGKVYTARNTGIEAASGEVIAFTDADCVVGPRWLASVHDAIFTSGATFVMGAVGFPSPRSALLDIIEIYRNDHTRYVIENRIWNHLYGYTNNMAVRADVFERLGLLEELPIPGDTEIVHRCLRRDPETPIAFREDMWVDHLEIVNARILFRKQVDYGEFEIHLPEVRYKPRNCRRKSGAVAHSIRKNGFSIRKRILFRFGVVACNACFQAGQWRGRLRGAFRRLKGRPT